MENLKRRKDVEIKNSKDFGITKFSKDLLQVADVLEMAIENIPAELRENETFNKQFEGMEGTHKMMLKVRKQQRGECGWLDGCARAYGNNTALARLLHTSSRRSTLVRGRTKSIWP